MAVEARQINASALQSLCNRNLMINGVESNGNVYGTLATFGIVAPLSGITAATDSGVPMYESAFTDNNVQGKAAAMKSDSGLTYAMPVSRKRSRDEISPSMLSSFQNVVQVQAQNQNADSRCSFFPFLGDDVSFQMLQQQMEIDRFITQHTEKVRMEMEDKRRRYSRRIAAAVEESVMKKMKAKDEEIEKIGKMNWALEEKVKSLCVENQIWRDLAQSNEATANALRFDLEQVQYELHQQRFLRTDDTALVDDAQSCCGSNYEDGTEPAAALMKKTKKMGGNSDNRICRSCGNNESCVLFLPCRHLCLCTSCGSFLHTCPLCNSVKTASLQVNLP